VKKKVKTTHLAQQNGFGPTFFQRAEVAKRHIKV
jgi:hypothetical protein